MKNWSDNDLKVGDRIVNKYGDHGTVTWVSGGFSTYKVTDLADDNPRPAKTCDTGSCDFKIADNVRLATALSKIK